MPHSNRALILLHEDMVNGGRISAEGLLLPLSLSIYVQIEQKRKRIIDIIQVGEAWCFKDSNLGVEANVHIDETRIPEQLRRVNLYPDIDLAASAIEGDNYRRVVARAEVRAIFLDPSSLWERMPPVYWPEVQPTRYEIGVASTGQQEALLGPTKQLETVPPAPAQRDEEWFPWP